MPNSLIDQLGTLPQIGAVVHLGAGSGLELPGLLATSAQRFVLVEPNAAVLPALKKSASDKRCEVLALAVAEDEGQAPLHQFNFPALSSLKTPLTALTDLLPGLSETGTATVTTLPLEALLARLKLDRSEKNVLIIDAPGVEGQIVDMALALDPATWFAHIILRAAAGAMYEGARGFSKLGDTLEAAGYRLESLRSDDPDFPEGLFRLDPLALKSQRLEADLEECRAARLQAEETAAARKKKSDELEQRLKALTAENETLSASADTRKKAATELEQRLKAMTAEKETLSATAEARKQAAVELEQRLKTLTAENETMRKTISAHKEKQAAQDIELKNLRSESATLQEQATRESASRQKMETEFLRAEAQMQLLKEFMDLNAQRDGPVRASTPPARPSGPRTRKKPR